MLVRKCLKTLLAPSEGYMFVLVMQMSAKMSPEKCDKLDMARFLRASTKTIASVDFS